MLWKGAPTSLYPLRAGKGWCYEGGIRIPLIIKPAGDNYKAKIVDQPVVSMDLYPTLVDMAGIKPVPDQYVDGIDITPAMNGKKLKRNTLFWHYPHYHGSGWTPGASVRSGDWKLIEFYEYDESELYNIKNDIGEKNDLSSTMPDKTDSLKTLLKEMQKETGAKLPVPKKEQTVTGKD